MSIFSVKIDPREGFLSSGKWPWLRVSSAGPALHVFVNDQLAGASHDRLFFMSFTLASLVLH